MKKRTMKVPCVLSIQTLWENSVLTLVHMLLLYRVQPVQHIYWIDIILDFILFFVSYNTLSFFSIGDVYGVRVCRAEIILYIQL